MGGRGSGRNDYASTPTVEECRSMDIDDLKEATKHPDADGLIWWGDREDPDSRLSWEAEGERHLEDETRPEALRFKYTITDKRTGEETEVDYPVPLKYTECNFGGYRPWFRCPGVVDGERCGRRARKLYLPRRRWAEYYLCRECYDLGYTSSRTSGDELKQAELRYRRAFAKADAENRRPHPNSEPWLPERPKGMHHDTFEDLLEDVRTAETEWTAAMQQRTRDLLNHYQTEAEIAARKKRSDGLI